MKERLWRIFKGTDKEREELDNELHLREVIIGNQPTRDIHKEKFGGIADDQPEIDIVINEHPEATAVTEKIKPALSEIESAIKRKEDEIAEIKNKLDRLKEYKEYQQQTYELAAELANLESALVREKDPEKRKEIEAKIRYNQGHFSAATVEIGLRRKIKEALMVGHEGIDEAEKRTQVEYESEQKKLGTLRDKLRN